MTKDEQKTMEQVISSTPTNISSYDLIPASTEEDQVITDQPRPRPQILIDTSAQRLMRVQLKANHTVYGSHPRPDTEVITVQPRPERPFIPYQFEEPGPFAHIYWYDVPCCICTAALCKVAEGFMAMINCRPCCPQ